MALRRILPFALAAALCATPAHAQVQQSYYVLGEAGASFGDGGGAPALAAGFGFLTSRNIGVELEVSYIPSLRFDEADPLPGLLPFGGVRTSGRVVGLQTQIVAVLPGGGTKLRTFVTGGGGIADVERRVQFSSFPEFLTIFEGLPQFEGLTTFPDFRLLLPRDFEQTRSDASLVLSGGAGVEYALTGRFDLGIGLRYQRVFSNPSALDMARLGLRAKWKF